MIFTLENLGIAYRKAKVDMYYSSNPNVSAIADYEEDLPTKLALLLARLIDDDEEWIKDPSFLGSWTLATKKITVPDVPTNGVIFSSPDEEWKNVCRETSTNTDLTKTAAEFRLMADVSLDFHVLSSLWILEVGHLYDQKLPTFSFGNRLRRKADGDINRFSLGSFAPYLNPFRKWRDGGIETMRSALEADKRVVALTADISSFYHELNPGFMLQENFSSSIDIELSEEQKKLHRLFIRALQAWSATTPLKKGLPVGLPASAVVANMALIELDSAIAKEVMPLYYGRYVDDIILVLENGADFRSSRDLWEWLFVRVNTLKWENEEEKNTIQFCPSYLEASKIRFGNDKNKVFLLAGETGKILVDSILYQIRERASEWRALPNLPLNAEHVGTDLVKATQNDGEAADNLRKADSLTMRRSGFAIKLRDFEAYERDLPPASWAKHRHTFYRAFIQHVVVLPQYFELATYLPRVIKLATACEDFSYVLQITRRIKKITLEISEHCGSSIKSCAPEYQPSNEEILGRWRQELYRSVAESIVASFPSQLSSNGKLAWLDVADEINLILAAPFLESISGIRKAHQRLFSYDLAHMPFRFIGLPNEMTSKRGIPKKDEIVGLCSASTILPEPIVEGAAELSKLIKMRTDKPHGLLFPVRPFSLAELCILADEPFSESELPSMRKMVLAARGFNLSTKMPKFDNHGTLQIPESNGSMRFGISVSSWSTRHDSWIAAVMGVNDPDPERYARLAQLVNSVISSPKRSRYLVLPELAMPARWFMRVSQKLQRQNISLITGVEYLHANKSRVRNQIWAAFSHEGLGFPTTMIYRQDKQKPALHEEKELRRLNGIEMKPRKTWNSPPVIQHGNFRFAMVVCSELTNISYRTALRGKVDALFVPEWNQDTDTFNALVESAALDIHAFIIQCNDRRYGDSRIRAPYKDSWQRDVLRVKGGTADYCVNGDIDVQALRKFQSSHRSPAALFKPVPDGFRMSYSRRDLPMND